VYPPIPFSLPLSFRVQVMIAPLPLFEAALMSSVPRLRLRNGRGAVRRIGVGVIAAVGTDVSVGRAVGDGVAVGVFVAVGVGVGVTVGVTVAVAVEVLVAVAVGVAVAVAVAVGVVVEVGVGVGKSAARAAWALRSPPVTVLD